jgi:hypothetical protein
MADFRHIEPGWYFVHRFEAGLYIGEKLDGTSLPRELQGEQGDEHNIRVPRNGRNEDFSSDARKYGHFNTRVIATTTDSLYKFDYCHSDTTVDAFSPRALESVVKSLQVGLRKPLRRM